ncbi:MAG: gliding motility-associated C-terminal domain-containing protein [Bacteroidota bacterium]
MSIIKVRRSPFIYSCFGNIQLLLISFIVILIFFSNTSANAQCCSCNFYGNELVTNGDFSSGNSGFTTGYIFSANAGPGNFGITADAGTVNPGSWANCHDRTSGTGNLMWLNLTSTSSLNIWTQTINGILPNTNYLFSCWVCNLQTGDPATLQLSVNGNLVGDSMSAPPTSCNWIRLCFIWYSGNNTSATLSITNQSQHANGNDIGLDDISFLKCNPSTFSFFSGTICQGSTYQLPDGTTVSTTGVYLDTLQSIFGCDSVITTTLIVDSVHNETVNALICAGNIYHLPGGSNVTLPGIYIDTLQTPAGCDSIITTTLAYHPPIIDSVITTAVTCNGAADGTITVLASNGSPPYLYQVRFVAINSTGVFNDLDTGTYTYIIVDSIGCKAIGTAVITEPDPITIEVHPDITYIDANEPVQLIVTCTNCANATFQWTPPDFLSCDTCFNPVATPDNDINYQVSVIITSNGKTCTADTITYIHVNPHFFLPNSFTPNNDGKNDVLEILGDNKVNAADFEITIYNRWGQPVFKSNDINFQWNGTFNNKKATSGIYQYIIKYYHVSDSKHPVSMNGHLTILN